ncbi:MAG: trimeric intracellular cation channel family protein [Planctomycetaceae bacterium]
MTISEVIEVSAVITGAVYGVLLARRKNMDLVGIVSVAFMTAFGGGTLRDVLLDHHPLFWIRYSGYSVLVFLVAVGGSLVPRIPRQIEQSLAIPDALGLGLFSVAGTQAALLAGTTPFVATMFGVITGTFGGVIGDIVCNEIPSLFRPHTPLYATCAFVGSWTLFAGQWLNVPAEIGAAMAVSVTVAMRLIAVRWNICLSGHKTD